MSKSDWTPDQPLVSIRDVHKSFGHISITNTAVSTRGTGDLGTQLAVVFTSSVVGWYQVHSRIALTRARC